MHFGANSLFDILLAVSFLIILILLIVEWKEFFRNFRSLIPINIWNFIGRFFLPTINRAIFFFVSSFLVVVAFVVCICLFVCVAIPFPSITFNTMSHNTTALTTALETVKQATQLDASGKYNDALHLYQASLSHFETALSSSNAPPNTKENNKFHQNKHALCSTCLIIVARLSWRKSAVEEVDCGENGRIQ